MTRMLLLEIELDQIRPLREYWGLLGNIQWQLFYLIWKWVRGSKSLVSVYLLLSCRNGTIDE